MLTRVLRAFLYHFSLDFVHFLIFRHTLGKVDEQKTNVIRCHTSGRNALEDILKNIVPDDIVRPGEGEGLKEGLDEFLPDKAVLSGGTSFAFLFLRFNLFD